ncbi:helix-turn-helix transcriptional regulator [Helicobacter typhlonius]|uniref:Transcriptional regulator, putative n=1 Tax=Helicobacter typhlonius TaxID=76936 RepID=A0A099UGG5_9HELI|nr:WYL domain-containing protein [Helicobacter typhlonius]TLD78817.1 WYL domain-containing protein [Helicobacter typhlonius]CUU40812.1 transcriptional regulator, putative [Helicobacter typhlonius]HCD73324.1 transcriptional regulator [Helicobacter sp.]
MAHKDNTSTRIVEILKLFLLGQSIDLKALSQEFNVSLRTIQRDMEKLCKHLPIQKSNGIYTLEPYALGRLSYKDLKHFAKQSGLANLYPKLDADFIVDLLNPNITQSFIITPPNRQMPDYDTFEKLSIAILTAHKISFAYKDKTRLVEPYKIIHIKGIWYLLAAEKDKLKHFTLSKIHSLRQNSTQFKPKKEILALIDSQNTEFRNECSYKATIHISSSALEFFTRKGMPKNLKQLRTNSSGAIFEVSYAFKDEVINLAKMWLPAIRILEPKELQTHLENLLKTYLQKAKRQIL